MGMKFEWDERKRRENIAKHGIDFADLRQAYGEERWIGVGLLRS
jgi:uncharacterized DUF497 family protein